MISIITINYNNLIGLKRTIKSVNSQSYEGYRWVLVDGNSSDSSADEIISTSKGRNNVSFISEPDAGIYDAMNKGIQILQEYNQIGFVIFMNSGDEFEGPNVLSDIVKILNTNIDKDLIYGSHTIVKNNTFTTVNSRSISKISLGMPTSHQAMFFNLKFLINNKYDTDFCFGADYDLVCKILKNSGPEKIKRINDVICKFHHDGVSNINRKSALIENFRTRRNVLKKSLSYCVTLYFLHYVHTTLKTLFPKIMLKIRAKK